MSAKVQNLESNPFGGNPQCKHNFVFDEHGHDIGVNNDGDPWEEKQELWTCRNCGATIIKSVLTTWINDLEELSESLENKLER